MNALPIDRTPKTSEDHKQIFEKREIGGLSFSYILGLNLQKDENISGHFHEILCAKELGLVIVFLSPLGPRLLCFGLFFSCYMQ